MNVKINAYAAQIKPNTWKKQWTRFNKYIFVYGIFEISGNYFGQ